MRIRPAYSAATTAAAVVANSPSQSRYLLWYLSLYNLELCLYILCTNSPLEEGSKNLAIKMFQRDARPELVIYKTSLPTSNRSSDQKFRKTFLQYSEYVKPLFLQYRTLDQFAPEALSRALLHDSASLPRSYHAPVDIAVLPATTKSTT
jgi:hypothetical protein